MGELSYLDYNKVSDTLMFFSKEISLKFCLSLYRKDQNGKSRSIISEYKYTTDYSEGLSIRRFINPYFLIDDSKNFENGLMIRPSDILLLKMVIDKLVIPWFVGNKRIYSNDTDNKLFIKGKWSPADFAISDYKYLSFSPIVLVYENETTKEGIRITINDPSNFVDVDINKFLEFYYYISKVDMYNAALNILNYVKTMPYGVNLTDINNGNNYGNDWESEKGPLDRKNIKSKSYFDKL